MEMHRRIRVSDFFFELTDCARVSWTSPERSWVSAACRLVSRVQSGALQFDRLAARLPNAQSLPKARKLTFCKCRANPSLPL
jgi:hypothetical protein